MLAINARSQTPSGFHYQNPQWIYLQEWTDWFQSPPVTSYGFLTCKGYGDTLRNGKYYMKIDLVPSNGPNAFYYYRQSNDSVFNNYFIPNFTHDDLYAYYGATPGGFFDDVHDTVVQVSNTTFLNGDNKRVFDLASYNAAVIDTAIEDAGFLNSPWVPLAYTQINPTWSRLVCFSDGGTLLYYVPVNFTYNSVTYSNPCSNLVTSLDDHNTDMSSEIIVSHDPAQQVIHVSNITSAEVQLDIFDAMGKLVMRRKIAGSSEIISTSMLRGGLYFYSICNREKGTSGKIIIY